MTRDETPSASPSDVLALDPIYIPGLITPVHTDGADGGVNHHLIHSHVSGLVINVQPYLNMQANDWIEVFWGDDTLPVASDRVLPEHVDKPFALFVRASRIPEGVHNVYATVTRSGGGNGGTTADLGVLVRTVFPGGTDPDPGAPGHQNLAAPEPALPPNGIIDEEAAKNGINVTIPGYPNMRIHDTVRLDWGGESVLQAVTQADVDAGFVVILVTEQTILAAGDGDQLLLIYRIWDEVHNQSSDWSLRTYVSVEVGTGLFPAPVIENPDAGADPYDVIDLEKLGEDDLLVDVVVFSNGLLKGDLVTLTWTGTPAQGQPVSFTPEPQEVSRDPQVMSFLIPNAEVRGLALGHGVASYTVSRDGSPAGSSRRAFATFVGVEQRLPKPQVRDAVNGVLDPTLEETLVTIPGEALEAGDTVFLTWLGTRANGSALLHTDERGVSGGSAGKPMTFSVGAEHIAPLDGGSVSVYYRLNKGATDTDLDSAHEFLSVGDIPFELTAPTTEPRAQDGIIDPQELPGHLIIIVPPWPDMQAEQTVHLVWKASSGPQYSDYMPISPAMVGKDVKFNMEQSTVEDYRGAAVELSYWIERPGEPSLTSASTAFRVETRVLILPPPEILEADGNELDPDLLPDGATISIDASAQFADGDELTVWVSGNGEDGSVTLEHTVAPGAGGKGVTLPLSHGVISANIGGTFDLRYEITRAAGGPVEPSETVTYSVIADIGSGPLRIMGARSSNSCNGPARSLSRMLTALHDETLMRVLAEWRYEDQQQWTASTHWLDEKPWLKLYVRSRSETWECRQANIFGNGSNDAWGSYVAIRDEVIGENGPEVDMVAWGNAEFGGVLDGRIGAIDNVADISASLWDYAARLKDGNVVCWGYTKDGSIPPTVYGDHVQVMANASAFVGRKRDGELHSWGVPLFGVPVPDRILEHRDYTNLYSSRRAFAALRSTGHIVAWGDHLYGGQLHDGQETLTDIIDVAGNTGAFVALRESAGSKRVMTWGHIDYGGLLPEDIARLTNVRSLAAITGQAFCILLETGEVKAWPYNLQEGSVPDDIARLKNVVQVSATECAFCVLLGTGKVHAWGRPGWGAKLSPEAASKSNIVQVVGNANSFAALCSDGTVVTWGHDSYGGDSSAVADQLVDVRAIYANHVSFVALTKDGRVVTWGRPESGGDSSRVQPELAGKVTARRLMSSADAETFVNTTHPYGEKS